MNKTSDVENYTIEPALDIKESLSPRYSNFFVRDTTDEEKEEISNIISLKNEIFDGVVSPTGRNYRDVLKTTQELVTENRYLLTQKDVSKYWSEKKIKERERTLKKDLLFDPPVVLGKIVPYNQRESRTEGLNRSSYDKALEFAVHKLLFTSGIPTMNQLANLGKVLQFVTGERWIDESKWVGGRRLDDGDIERITAEIMAKKLGIEPEEAIIQGERIVALNDSEATYLNENDQHKIPASQGGLSQIPMSIASHWFEHTQVAVDAADVLQILIEEKKKRIENDNLSEDQNVVSQEELNELIRLAYFSYQANTPSAELIRHAPALYSNLSNKYILEYRREVSKEALSIIDKAKAIDDSWISLLSEEDLQNIKNISERIVTGRGSTPQDELTKEEKESISNLSFIADLIERDTSINKLNKYLSDLQRTHKKGLNLSYVNLINGLITRLENNTSPLYLDNLSEDEYNAILALQEQLDESILINIVTPRKLGCVRPEWKFRLDLDTLKDVTISPYNEKGTEIRKLADVLETPCFNGILQRPQVPKREALDFEKLKDPDLKLSYEIYGPTRDLNVIEGYSANLILSKYYESLGISSKEHFNELMFPTEKNLQPPSALQNVEEAAEIIYGAIIKGEKIATIADCDQDGFNATNNMRWALEKIGVPKVDQKFNTRIEGHSVQLTDLINLGVAGNKLIIICDTGSSDEDCKAFQTFHSGTNKISDLQYFLDNIERINGFAKFPEEQKKSIKRRLQLFITNNPWDTFNKEGLFSRKFTFVNPVNNIESKSTLGSYEPLRMFVNGFKNDVRLIVCDHHTPSIKSIEYFLEHSQDIMVNPQWVMKWWKEIDFINEMQEALTPDENGVVDHEKIDRTQRKYRCYPESDLVGTVTTGKVIRRVMNLFSDEPIVKARSKEYLLQSKEKREKLLKKYLDKDFDSLSLEEQRFVLEQSGNMPKSFFEMDTKSKEIWAREKIIKLAEYIDEDLVSSRIANKGETPLSDAIHSWITLGKHVRDVKKELFNIIEAHLSTPSSINQGAFQPPLFEDDRLIPNSKKYNKKRREKARKLGNEIWNLCYSSMEDSKELTVNESFALKSYLKHGPFGLQQLKLLEATATIGDGGSIGIGIGMENRYIVKDAMRELTDLSKQYQKEPSNTWRERQFKRILPESLRFIRIALRETNFTAVNYYNSRFFSHIMAASTNAIYRRAKPEEALRADSVLPEISDVFIKKSETNKIRRHRHTLPYAQDKAIQRREELLEEHYKYLDTHEDERERPLIIIEQKGLEYIDALQGQRGLIAGNISERYEKPTMVIVEEGENKENDSKTYSVSFRLPARGNVSTDMIQLYLEKNPQPGIKIIAHGGHPLASGGTWQVQGGIEQLHNVLDPLFEKYKPINPDAGVVKIETTIKELKNELKKSSPELIKSFNYLNPFAVADIISTHISQQINPYGTDFPKLLLEFEELKVVGKSRGKKVDGESYQTITVEDRRGNRRVMRLFKKLTSFDKVRIGDTVSLRVQPIMRLTPMPPAKLIYRGPFINEGDVTSIDGQKSRPTLDIEKIISIKRTQLK